MTSPGFGFRKRLCPKMEKYFKLPTPQKEEIVKRTVCDEAVTYKNKQVTIAEVHRPLWRAPAQTHLCAVPKKGFITCTASFV